MLAAGAAVWFLAVVLPSTTTGSSGRAAIGYGGHVAFAAVLVGASAWYGMFASAVTC